MIKIGDRYARLVIVEVPKSWNSQTRIKCVCDCGEYAYPAVTRLRHNKSRSCGCLQKEVTKQNVQKYCKKHGMTYSPEWRSWIGAKSRCLCKTNPKYRLYGARGIKISEEWRKDFNIFFRDMGKRPSKNHSLDRIDPNGDYCKENCRWSTQSEQQNNRRNNTFLEMNGDRMTIAQWARKTGISQSAIIQRMVVLGYSVERALTQPVRKRNH